MVKEYNKNYKKYSSSKNRRMNIRRVRKTNNKKSKLKKYGGATETDKGQIITEFKSIVGDVGDVKQILENANWDINTALNIFYEGVEVNKEEESLELYFQKGTQEIGLGINNPLFQCYLISLIQCLTSNPIIVEYLKQNIETDRGDIINYLYVIAKQKHDLIRDSKFNVISFETMSDDTQQPGPKISAIRKVKNLFDGFIKNRGLPHNTVQSWIGLLSEQQCSSEAFQYLYELIQNNGFHGFSELFVRDLIQYFKCGNCENKALSPLNTREPMNALNPVITLTEGISNSNISIQKLLNNYFGENTTEGFEDFNCLEPSELIENKFLKYLCDKGIDLSSIDTTEFEEMFHIWFSNLEEKEQIKLTTDYENSESVHELYGYVMSKLRGSKSLDDYLNSLKSTGSSGSECQEARENIEKLEELQRNASEAECIENGGKVNFFRIKTESIPPILVLSCAGRTAYNPVRNEYIKNTNAINIDDIIDIKTFLDEENSDKELSGETTYKLSCLNYHDGQSINSGHYYADCLINGIWYRFNDAQSNRLPDDYHPNNHLENQKKCYLLFYQKTDTKFNTDITGGGIRKTKRINYKRKKKYKTYKTKKKKLNKKRTKRRK